MIIKIEINQAEDIEPLEVLSVNLKEQEVNSFDYQSRWDPKEGIFILERVKNNKMLGI